MSASASMPLQYKRLYKGSLDQDDVFDNIEDAEVYAKGPTAYGGHIIGVLDQGKRKSFIVNDNGTLDEQLDMDDLKEMLSWVDMNDVPIPPEPNIPSLITKNGEVLVTKAGEVIIFK